MPARRLPERDIDGSDEPTPIQRANANLMAINMDLRRQIALLESSRSYRLGQRIIRLLQPIFRVLRLHHLVTRSPEVRIETLWPRVQGRITVFTPSIEQIPVRVWANSHDLISASIDPASVVIPHESGPWTGTFSFDYPLGIQPMDARDLRARVGSVEISNADVSYHGSTNAPILRPIDIVVDSISHIDGDVDRFRSLLDSKRSVAVLATFRGPNRPEATPTRLIAELRRLGFALIVVDTSESRSSEIDCDLYMHRRNEGWDFASWLAPLAAMPWISETAENLLLVNDSNIGPLDSLDRLFERGRKLDADVWGLTDSWAIQYHLQSYFLHFNRTALKSDVLQKFAESFTFPMHKADIIGSGEVGLSQLLIDHGCKIAALFPYTQLAQKYLDDATARIRELLALPENAFQSTNGLTGDIHELNFILDTIDRIRSSEPLNPTHHFWDILLADGFPFIKRDLLMTNKIGVPGLHRLTSLLSTTSQRDVLVEELRTWSRKSRDLSLPLALHWQPSANSGT